VRARRQRLDAAVEAKPLGDRLEGLAGGEARLHQRHQLLSCGGRSHLGEAEVGGGEGRVVGADGRVALRGGACDHVREGGVELAGGVGVALEVGDELGGDGRVAKDLDVRLCDEALDALCLRLDGLRRCGGGLVVLRAEYANLRAGGRSCAASSEHRVTYDE